MAGNPNFDALLSTTLNNYRKTLEDNIFNAMPLLYWLKSKKRKTIVDGGVKIVVPLMYGKNETVSSYSGYDPIDTTPENGISSAEFNWKQVAGSITISREEERKNAGESRMINLLSSKIMQCEMSLQDAITTMLFSDGTGNSGKDLLGLKAIVANAPTTGVLGGIDRASNSWWRNQSVVGTKTSTKFDNLIEKMRNMYNSASKGNSHPDFIVADQATYEGYEGQLVLNERFADKDTADGGFENLKFKGAVVTFDDACPATATLGNMYFLNSKFLSWTVDKETDFITSPFVRPENQDAKTAQVLLMAQFVVSNCARNGVIYNISLT